MKYALAVALAALAPFAFTVSAAQQASSYAGQESREIKSLSPEEIDAYLTGKGAGLAKAAELNGYAGPKHVLELAEPLALTDEQRSQTQSLFAAMQARASDAGARLVEAERKLDRLFATKAVTPDLLGQSLGEIASLQAEVRAVHLQAHLDQVGILTPQQNARYAQLRGYGGHGASHGSHHGH